MKKQLLLLVMMLLPMVAHADYSGTCGSNLTWTFVESSGTLTISGSGAMTDFANISICPWNNCSSSIYKVVIEENVTSIGDYAFYYCTNLTSVTIGNSVVTIGERAFSFCTNLTILNIPNNVTSIGNSAFSECKKLTSITIPNSVTAINKFTFSGCSGLISVIIPNSVISIGDYAFRNCSSLTSVTIPNSVTSIGEQAFLECNGLTSLTLGSSITYIGNNTFSHCSGLTSVIIPNSVTYIGDFAFADCSGLASVTIPENVTSIGKCVFKDCTGLTSVNYLCSPTSIGSDIFYNCTNIQEVTFDCDKVISIFSGLSSITKIFLTDKVISIDNHAFSGCSSLTSVTIPNSVTSIGNHAFSDCSGLTSVTISNSVTCIGDQAFSDCSGLTSVVIPNSVTSIGNYAFQNCCSLTSITIGSSVNTIGIEAFGNDNLKKTFWLTNTLPLGYGNAVGAVNYVSNDQFDRIKNVVIYPFLSSLFEVDGVKYVPVSPSERTCDAIDCIYSKSVANAKIPSSVNYKGIEMAVKNIMPYFACNNNYIESLTFENDGKISDYAFSGCNLLSDITIPKSITAIGNYAFWGCEGINKIIIEDREDVLSLGSNGSNPLFSSCPLDTVYIGGNISYPTMKNYGYSPFYRNVSLKAIHITDKETEISDNEFYGCTNLRNVRIGNSVKRIGNWAFSGCSSLDFFAFGSNMESIGMEAFSDCSNVTKIISLASMPPTCGSQALDDINKWNCRLVVPATNVNAYKVADQWKDFLFIEGSNSDEDGINQLKINDILIQNEGNILKVTGAPKGTEIYVYSLAGKIIGSSKMLSECTNIITSLHVGDVGIVKIADKSVKVLMK